MAKEPVPAESDDPAYKSTALVAGYLSETDLPGEPYVTRLQAHGTQEWLDAKTEEAVERSVGRVEGYIFRVGLATNDHSHTETLAMASARVTAWATSQEHAGLRRPSVRRFRSHRQAVRRPVR